LLIIQYLKGISHFVLYYLDANTKGLIADIDVTNIFTVIPVIVFLLLLSPQMDFMFKPSWEILVLGKKAKDAQIISSMMLLYVVILAYNFSPIVVGDKSYWKALAFSAILALIAFMISACTDYHYKRLQIKPKNRLVVFMVSKGLTFFFVSILLLVVIVLNEYASINNKGLFSTIVFMVSLVETLFISFFCVSNYNS